MNNGTVHSGAKLCARQCVILICLILTGCFGQSYSSTKDTVRIVEVIESAAFGQPFTTHHFEFSDQGELTYITFNSDGAITSAAYSETENRPEFSALQQGCLSAERSDTAKTVTDLQPARLRLINVTDTGLNESFDCSFNYSFYQHWLESDANSLSAFLTGEPLIPGIYVKVEPYDGNATVDYVLQDADNYQPLVNILASPNQFKRIENAVTLSLLNKKNDNVYFLQHENRYYVLFKFELQ